MKLKNILLPTLILAALLAATTAFAWFVPEFEKVWEENDPVKKRRQEIAELLRQAEDDLAAVRLTKPDGTNAFDRYQRVLQLEPGNAEAQQGLRRIADKYRELAARASGSGDRDKARQYEELAGRIAPGAAPTSGGSAGRSFTDPTTGMEFVLVKGGCYQMGQTEAEKRYLIKERGEEKYKQLYDDEKPRHQVCVDDLYVARHEVTVGQFRRFVRESGYRTDAEKNAGGKEGCYTWKEGKWDYRAGTDWQSPGFEQGDSQPAVCVSWNDSQAYIDWLNRKGGKSYRLATEAEWEYAARGGSGSIRFWGDDPDQACRYANVADQSRSPDNYTFNTKHECNDGYWFTAPVGSFKANAFGLYDMLGNVWEWTGDWYSSSYYASSPRNNPKGPSTGSYRVLRGGSWFSNPTSVRSANRSGNSATDRLADLGFRLVSSGQ